MKIKAEITGNNGKNYIKNDFISMKNNSEFLKSLKKLDQNLIDQINYYHTFERNIGQYEEADGKLFFLVSDMKSLIRDLVIKNNLF